MIFKGRYRYRRARSMLCERERERGKAAQLLPTNKTVNVGHKRSCQSRRSQELEEARAALRDGVDDVAACLVFFAGGAAAVVNTCSGGGP